MQYATPVDWDARSIGKNRVVLRRSRSGRQPASREIDVDVTNGIVSLRGKLGNAGINEAAIKKTQSIQGVKKVVNLLD